RNFPVMLRAAAKLRARFPGARFLVACLHDRHRSLVEGLAAASGAHLELEVHAARTAEGIRLADVAWSVSGSVGLDVLTEAAPTVVLYKLTRFDLLIARPFIRAKYISLVNLLADAEVMPEYLTEHDVSDELAAWAGRWLGDASRWDRASSK